MLEENLKYIRKSYKQLEQLLTQVPDANDLYPISAKDGTLSLMFRKDEVSKLIHSRYNPKQESIEFINSLEIHKDDIPIIVGLGLGYHIESLLERFADFEQIFIIEPRLDVIKFALEHRDLSQVLKHKNISIISSITEGYILNALNDILKNTRFHKRTKFIVHQPSLVLYRHTHPTECDFIKRMNVEPKMQQIMKDNFKLNLGFTMHSPGINSLFSKFDNIPIVLISAGPSLNKDLETLKTIQDKAIIISVSTPLKLLLKNGIKPDLISVGDPKQIMITHFEDSLDCNVPLLFLPTISHELLMSYSGPKIVALQNDYKLCDTVSTKVNKGRVDVGESVATLNLDVAIKLGANPIIFVGQDLAFSDGHSHAAGVEKRLKVKSQNKMVENVQGEMVATSMSLSWFKDWIERRIAKDSDKVYINVSQTGARIKGTQELSLKEVAKQYCNNNIDKSPLYSLFNK